MSQLPPGWYVDEAGQNRYWTGTEWVTAATGTPPVEVSKKKLSKTGKLLISGSLAGLLLIGGGIGLSVMDGKKKEAAAEQAADEARLAEEARAAEQKEKELQEENRLEKAKLAEEKAQAEAIELLADETLVQLEEMAFTLAKDTQADLYLDKILKVTCMPAGGTDVASIGVTVTDYSCMAVTEENKDGSYRGYNMVGTVNWGSGELSVGWDF